MAKKTDAQVGDVGREYVIPLREQVRKVPRYKKANKAIRTIKEFLARHMRIRDRDLKKIKVDKYLNEQVWSRGIRKPPASVKVKAIKKGDIVIAELVDFSDKLKFKKAREEKQETLAKDVAKKRKAEKTATETPETKEEVKNAEESKEVVEEKAEAVAEQEQKIDKAVAKAEKHTTKVKSPQQEKNAQTGYNQTSRGH